MTLLLALRARRLARRADEKDDPVLRHRALLLVESWLRQAPEDPAARLLRGRLLLGLGEAARDPGMVARARGDFEAVLQGDAESLAGLLGRAVALHSEGDFRGDAGLLEEAGRAYLSVRRAPGVSLPLLAHTLLLEAMTWDQLEEMGVAGAAARRDAAQAMARGLGVTDGA